MTLVWSLIIAVVFLALAAVFATIQEAFATMTKGRAHQLVEDERKHGESVEEIAHDPAPTVSTALFLRLVGQVGFTVVLVWLFVAEFPAGVWRLFASGAIVLVVLYIVISVGARTVGRQHTEGVTLATAKLMGVLTTILFVIPQVMILIGNAITPGRGYPDGPFTSEDELREFVERAEASNQIEADERKMIYSVFDLGDTLVREVMVPRPDVVYIESTKTLRQALSLALRSGYSRIPVAGPGGLDDIVGIAYLKDIIKRVYDKADSQSAEQVVSIARPVSWCPDSKPADDLLREMQAERSHMSVVVDEFGGTAGIVSIEDLLEEIVGEIRDEYDTTPDTVTKISDGVYRVSSRLSLADLGDLFGQELDDEDVDSVGGILSKLLNKVPIPDSTVTWEGLELSADQFGGRRHQMTTVLVRRESESGGSQDSSEAHPTKPSDSPTSPPAGQGQGVGQESTQPAEAENKKDTP
ncbi:MAG: hemolysin family protein [Propionibacteriaceae bacterium]|jgi:CBS domain containing-hemolysin-like protein|nr:hemolysin family protein [Propionibacteriaceae bacterium]